MLFLSSRFSNICSASASFRSRASARSDFTSLEVAWRAVSPARRFLPASRNSPSTNCNTGYPRCPRDGTAWQYSPRHADLQARYVFSLPTNKACASCDGYSGSFSRPSLSCSWISASSSFPSVTTMSQKPSPMKTPQYVPGALTSDNRYSGGFGEALERLRVELDEPIYITSVEPIQSPGR